MRSGLSMSDHVIGSELSMGNVCGVAFGYLFKTPHVTSLEDTQLLAYSFCLVAVLTFEAQCFQLISLKVKRIICFVAFNVLKDSFIDGLHVFFPI